MALAIVQHKSIISGNSVPGVVTLTSAPTTGNLIIAFLHTNTLTSGVVVNTTGWTAFETITSSISTLGYGFYRYVQGGDTAALPAFMTAATNPSYWSADVYEISGVSGTFATDVPLHNQTLSPPDSNVTSLTTANLSTTAPNAIALLGAGQYNGNADPTLSAGWTRDEFGHNNLNYGSTVGGSQSVASSGTSIGATVTFTTNSSPADIILVIVQPAGGGGGGGGGGTPGVGTSRAFPTTAQQAFPTTAQQAFPVT